MSAAIEATPGTTVADRLGYYRGRSTGFDELRLGFALSVVCWHAFYLTSNDHAPPFMGDLSFRPILPMFFALSGFLISGSLIRSKTLAGFLTLRATRIFPALAVEVLLSAVVIGGVFTTMPLHDYYTSGEFFNYLNNIYGNIQFHLPGVFAELPRPRVNQSLWTIPYELGAYLALSLLWIFGVIGNRRWLLALVVAMQVIMPLRDYSRGELSHWTNISGRMLMLSFLCGTLIYFYRDVIPVRKWMGGMAFAATLILFSTAETSYFAALPAAYLTVFLGLTNPPKIPGVMDGDYSYGIYLYGAVIQQAVVALFPAHRDYWFNLWVSIGPICACAAFSWHVIENPILGRRKSLVAFTARVVDAIAGPVRALRRGRAAS